jgi:DNA polymerase-3 subunit gamma/tau
MPLSASTKKLRCLATNQLFESPERGSRLVYPFYLQRHASERAQIGISRTIARVTGLATKHRPRRLADLVGQRHVTAVLQKALHAERLPHQLLFSGGSGLGKTTVARVVAAALLCESPVANDACGTCDSCLDIFEPNRSHPDVVEFDAASNGQKEQIRELAGRALTAPVRGKYRVYIIDEAHGLSQGGGQAFLKLLEEPPAHVIFMLATTDPDKMLRTNRGRCVEFELARPSDSELAEHLVSIARSENWALDTEAAKAVIQATDPALGVRGLLMTLEKLSDLLSWGTAPTIDEVAALLGLAPAAMIDAVWAAVCASDKQRALAELDAIRKRTSDASLRRALIERSRDALTVALASGSGELSLWRFEQLLTMPQGPLWTDLAVAKISRARHGEDARATEALLRDALNAVSRLEATIEEAKNVTPVPATIADQAAIDESRIEEDAQEDTQGETPDTAELEPIIEPEPPVVEVVPATPVDVTVKLHELLAARNKTAAAILRSCELRAIGDKVLVIASAAMITRLREHTPDVRAAAADCGISLSISVAS